MSYRILFIESAPGSTESIQRPLSEAGYEVFVANDAGSARATFERVRPDLAMIDGALPRLQDGDLCRELKDTELGRQTPIVLVDHDDDAAAVSGFDRRIDDSIDEGPLLTLCEGLLHERDEASGSANSVVSVPLRDADSMLDGGELVSALDHLDSILDREPVDGPETPEPSGADGDFSHLLDDLADEIDSAPLQAGAVDGEPAQAEPGDGATAQAEPVEVPTAQAEPADGARVTETTIQAAVEPSPANDVAAQAPDSSADIENCLDALFGTASTPETPVEEILPPPSVPGAGTAVDTAVPVAVAVDVAADVGVAEPELREFIEADRRGARWALVACLGLLVLGGAITVLIQTTGVGSPVGLTAPAASAATTSPPAATTPRATPPIAAKPLVTGPTTSGTGTVAAKPQAAKPPVTDKTTSGTGKVAAKPQAAKPPVTDKTTSGTGKVAAKPQAAKPPVTDKTTSGTGTVAAKPQAAKPPVTDKTTSGTGTVAAKPQAAKPPVTDKTTSGTGTVAAKPQAAKPPVTDKTTFGTGTVAAKPQAAKPPVTDKTTFGTGTVAAKPQAAKPPVTDKTTFGPGTVAAKPQAAKPPVTDKTTFGTGTVAAKPQAAKPPVTDKTTSGTGTVAAKPQAAKPPVTDKTTSGTVAVAAAAGFHPPEVLERIEPDFPASISRTLRDPATIVLSVLVDERGRIARVVVDRGSSDPQLEAAAVTAVLGWTYRPATDDGVPVKAWATARFTLHP